MATYYFLDTVEVSLTLKEIFVPIVIHGLFVCLFFVCKNTENMATFEHVLSYLVMNRKSSTYE